MRAAMAGMDLKKDFLAALNCNALFCNWCSGTKLRD
jgi:hypothetical protein